MAKAEQLAVSETDRAELGRWLRSSTVRKSHVERARIILLSAEGLSAEAIGAKLDVQRITVYKWRARYLKGGIPALADAPRPGQPRQLDPAIAAEILRRTIHEIPREATHWSLRLMAKAAKVSGTVVLEATIGPDGRVTDTRIVRSIPLLDQAAIDAVQQWEYKPTMVKGQAVPVIVGISVNFTNP